MPFNSMPEPQDLTGQPGQRQQNRSIQDWMGAVNTRAPATQNPFGGAADNLKTGMSIWMSRRDKADEAAKRDALVKALMGNQPQPLTPNTGMSYAPSFEPIGPAGYMDRFAT